MKAIRKAGYTLAIAGLLSFSSASFAATNVALGASVTLNGTFGVGEDIWCCSSLLLAAR